MFFALSNSPLNNGIVAGRLPAADYQSNFADHEAALDLHEARVAADRCYFCHDAPCITACPTSIDIPLFIRQIATGTPEDVAQVPESHTGLYLAPMLSAARKRAAE